MNQQNIEHDFSFELIKGKVAETVFEQMFRTRRDFNVIPFGYESVLPVINQFSGNGDAEKVKDNLRSAPDFAVIAHKNESIYLVEVKYRETFDIKKIMEIAESVNRRWKLAWLFLATPDGFYFSSCAHIKHNKTIEKLNSSWIPETTQKKYLAKLKYFIPLEHK